MYLLTEIETGGGGGMFEGGPQFVFNMGGGPGFRVHQFGGNRPRRRPPQPTAATTNEPPPSILSAFSNLLPLLLLFILPLLSSIFSSDSSSAASSGPTFRFDVPAPPHTLHRTTPRLKVDYYLDPSDVVDWNTRKLSQLDQKAEVSYLSRLRADCELEMERRQRMMQDAQGWFFQDPDKMREARDMEMRSCRRLDELRRGRL